MRETLAQLKPLLIGLVLLFVITQEDSVLSEARRSVRKGQWGGEHISVLVGDSSARLEYDCAQGTIDQPLEIDARGRFKAKGTHTPERGGPITRGEQPDSHPALYTGEITGDKMTISIVLADTKETVGSFTATFGKRPNLFKCR